MCGAIHLLPLYVSMAWKKAALTFYCFQIDVSWNNTLTTPLSLLNILIYEYIYIIKLYNYATSHILCHTAHTFAIILSNVRKNNQHIVQF